MGVAQTCKTDAAVLDLQDILRVVQELVESLRAYGANDIPNPDWWGVVVNRVWSTDFAINPKRVGYGSSLRDDHFNTLPITQSAPLCRIRAVVDKVACTFGLASVIGRKDLDSVIEMAVVAAGGSEHRDSDNYLPMAMPIDRRWVDELHSAAISLATACHANSPHATDATNAAVSAKMSPNDLAKKYEVPFDALRKRLDRWRYDHDTGYSEVVNPKRNEPRYLYDESAVMLVIEQLKARSARPKRAAGGQRENL